MEFGPSKAQRMLRAATVDLLKQNASVDRVREIMETETAFDAELEAALADQGALGLMVAEQHGGSGLGLFEAALVAQELGRNAAPFDLVTAAVVAPLLIEAAGDDAQREHWLGRIASGEEVIAVVKGIQQNDDTLRGVSSCAAAVNQATSLLVEVGGRCWMVPLGTSGVDVEHLKTVDETRRWSEVTLDDVAIADCERLANRVSSEELARIAQAGQITTAADSLGASYRGLEVAVEYAKGREQFGRIIGSFQAVKHLCAEMIAEVDPLQSLVWYAAYAWDERQDDVHYVAPLCKAHSAEVGYQCVTKATQVFGGVGFTWECDMHLYFKRVQVDRQLFGRPEELREQAAMAQSA